MIRVAVVGAAGRMGIAVGDAVVAHPKLELVGAVDPGAVGSHFHGCEIVPSLEALPTKPDVAIDFTVAAAARTNVDWCIANGVHAVVGTTGFDQADFERFRTDAATAGVGVVIAANFAIGAVLMMRFAELAAPFFNSVEIVEEHHDQKKDAPSGTSLVTAARIAAASSEWNPDPTEDEFLEGARGGKAPGDIPIHSLRVHGLVAHQEVVFGTEGQTLRIRHDSLDRTSFMPGVTLAAQWVVDQPGLTTSMDAILGI